MLKSHRDRYAHQSVEQYQQNDRICHFAGLGNACIYSQWGKFQPQQQQVDGCSAQQSPQMLNFLFLRTMDTGPGGGRTADIMLSLHLPRLQHSTHAVQKASHIPFLDESGLFCLEPLKANQSLHHLYSAAPGCSTALGAVLSHQRLRDFPVSPSR